MLQGTLYQREAERFVLAVHEQIRHARPALWSEHRRRRSREGVQRGGEGAKAIAKAEDAASDEPGLEVSQSVRWEW